jgi:hypothetical protein
MIARERLPYRPAMRVLRVSPCWARFHALRRELSRWPDCRDFLIVAQARLADRGDRQRCGHHNGPCALVRRRFRNNPRGFNSRS